MAANLNYRDLSCCQLSQILKSKGISYSNKKKEELISLCERAEALHLPDIYQADEVNASVDRRTVNGKIFPNPNSEDVGSLLWTPNLYGMPSIDAFDVTSFLYNYCGWSEERIKKRKLDNSYQLHCSGHVHDVTMSVLESDLYYIRGKCVPETRQSNDPYKPWVLVDKSGHILSGECTCVAGNGSCKHVTALLFGLVEQVQSLEDRSTMGVTDTSAYWDKPRKICRPVSAHNLNIRTDDKMLAKNKQPQECGYSPLQPNDLDPKRVEKDIVKMLKDSKTHAVALHILFQTQMKMKLMKMIPV